MCFFVLMLFFVFSKISNSVYFHADINSGHIEFNNCVIEEMNIDAKQVFTDITEEKGILLSGPVSVNGIKYDDDIVSVSFVPVSDYSAMRVFPLDKDGVIKCSFKRHPELNEEDDELPQTDSIRNPSNTMRGIKNFNPRVLVINCNEYVKYSGAMRIELSGCEVEVFGKDTYTDRKINIIVEGKTADYVDKNKFIQITNPQCNYVLLNNVYEWSSQCEGSISVDYIPTSKKYDLAGQRLSIKDNSSRLVAKIKSKEYQYSIDYRGYANEISLSGNSLLPDIYNYLKENVYLIPAMLITMIGGAISLVAAYARKKENN